MQMDSIRLFIDIAQQRSVSKGALLHGVTQSAASQRMKALEQELGARLFDRSTRPLKLTAAGETYYRGVRKILEQYEQLKRQITGAPAPVRGDVTIAAIYSAGINLLNEARQEFMRDHPDCDVEITYLRPEVVHDRLLHDQADIGILSYPARWRELASIPLREERMVVVCRTEHPLAERQVVRPADLSEWTMVGFEQALPIGRRIRSYLREHHAQVTIENEFDNIDTIKSYVAVTPTVAILPDRTVAREVSRGVLKAVTLEPKLVRPVAIVYPRQKDLKPQVKQFIEYLLKHQPLSDGTDSAMEAASASPAEANRPTATIGGIGS